MDELLKLTDRCHKYGMEYLDSCKNFVYENKDVITNVVNVACATAMVGMISKATVEIVHAINDKK
ncbi:hypothetical protein [Lactobacillus sp.]|uniref:hypothetical protein n=1 Tax=Lactobacillus sp. TaxID=1591 RepID=UPI00199EB164|nr:hypothetical protein [Lactobacillus sp.]MBD5429420.1 hypothetical protein [Lactobacillus sp.]